MTRLNLGKVVIISQARMTSTRLPGKVLMPAAGKPLLRHHLERLKRCRHADAVALATTTNADDDRVAALAESLGVLVHRGSEFDVLERFTGAARLAEADVVVRVTADCPLIDPALIEAAIERFAAGQAEVPPVDYVNIDTNRFPRGLDAEVFHARMLIEAAAEATDDYEREHVTPFIYRRPARYRLGAPLVPGRDPPAYRWCVDEAADLELIRCILDLLGPHEAGFGWQECCKVMERNPDWAAINRDVAQRKPA